MAVRLKKYSFRFSEELFNSRLAQNVNGKLYLSHFG